MPNTRQRKKSQNQLLNSLHKLEDSFLILLLSSMIILAVTQIVMRNVFTSGFTWADPMLRLLVLWVGLAGAMLATRRDHHINIDIFIRILAPGLQLVVRIFADLLSCLVTAIIAYHAMRLVQMDREAASIAFAQIPSWWCELILPLAFAVIAIRYLVLAYLHSKQLLSGWLQ